MSRRSVIKLNPENLKIKARSISSETPYTTAAAATKVRRTKSTKYIPSELVNQTRTTNLFFPLPAFSPPAFSSLSLPISVSRSFATLLFHDRRAYLSATEVQHRRIEARSWNWLRRETKPKRREKNGERANERANGEGRGRKQIPVRRAENYQAADLTARSMIISRNLNDEQCDAIEVDGKLCPRAVSNEFSA